MINCWSVFWGINWAKGPVSVLYHSNTDQRRRSRWQRWSMEWTKQQMSGGSPIVTEPALSVAWRQRCPQGLQHDLQQLRHQPNYAVSGEGLARAPCKSDGGPRKSAPHGAEEAVREGGPPTIAEFCYTGVHWIEDLLYRSFPFTHHWLIMHWNFFPETLYL